MIALRPVRDWISRHLMSMVIGLLVITLVSNWWLSRQNESLKTKLDASIKATEEISTAFTEYQATQGQILTGLGVLAETQQELVRNQRLLAGTIEGAAKDENRADDPFWGAVLDGVYNDTPDDPG